MTPVCSPLTYAVGGTLSGFALGVLACWSLLNNRLTYHPAPRLRTVVPTTTRIK